jgi:hypothetical protein
MGNILRVIEVVLSFVSSLSVCLPCPCHYHHSRQHDPSYVLDAFSPAFLYLFVPRPPPIIDHSQHPPHLPHSPPGPAFCAPSFCFSSSFFSPPRPAYFSCCSSSVSRTLRHQARNLERRQRCLLWMNRLRHGEELGARGDRQGLRWALDGLFDESSETIVADAMEQFERAAACTRALTAPAVAHCRIRSSAANCSRRSALSSSWIPVLGDADAIAQSFVKSTRQCDYRCPEPSEAISEST